MAGRQPTLVVFCGPPCAGKTTLGTGLSSERDLTHLQMDRFRSGLLPWSSHGRNAIDLAYWAMHRMAVVLLRLGRSVLLDSTYARTEQRKDVEGIACHTGARLYVVECSVGPQDAVFRFRHRPAGHAALDLTTQRVDALARGFPYCFVGLHLDTSKSPVSCHKDIDSYLLESPVSTNAWSVARARLDRKLSGSAASGQSTCSRASSSAS